MTINIGLRGGYSYNFCTVFSFKSTGAYKAASRLASATPPPAHILSRGIGWQGIGVLLDGLFGTMSGSSVSMYAAPHFHVLTLAIRLGSVFSKLI